MDEYGEVLLEEKQYYWLFHANDSYSAVKLLQLDGDDCRVEDYETDIQSDVNAGSLVGMIPAPGEITLRYVNSILNSPVSLIFFELRHLFCFSCMHVHLSVFDMLILTHALFCHSGLYTMT